MANTLSFRLALNSAAFSRGIKGAALQLGGLLGVALGVRRGFQSLWEAINTGGRLHALSAATGESIANLRQLEVAMVGLVGTAQQAPKFLLAFQRSLAEGKGLATYRQAWEGLGLEVEQLAKMPTPAAIVEVMKALRQMDKASAAGIASRLFGGRNALIMLQGARKLEGFTQDLARGAGQGDFWQKNARSFEVFTDSLNVAREEVQLIFAGLATGIMPLLQKTVDLVKQVDWVRIGEAIGSVTRNIIGTIADGGLMDLIVDVFTTAFQTVVALAPGIFAKLGTLILKILETPLTYFQAGLDYIIDQMINNPKVKLAVGVATQNAGLIYQGIHGVNNAQSFEELLAERKARGLEFSFGTGAFNTDDMDAAASEALAAGRSKMADLWSAFLERLKQRAPEMAAPIQALEHAGSRSADLGTAARAGGSRKTDATSLEKLGFVFNGIGRGFDVQRSMLNALTEANSQRQQLIEQNQVFLDQGGFDFAHA